MDVLNKVVDIRDIPDTKCYECKGKRVDDARLSIKVPIPQIFVIMILIRVDDG